MSSERGLLGAIKRRLGYGQTVDQLDRQRIKELDQRIETSLQTAREENDNPEVVEAHRDYDRLRQELGLVE